MKIHRVLRRPGILTAARRREHGPGERDGHGNHGDHPAHGDHKGSSPG